MYSVSRAWNIETAVQHVARFCRWLCYCPCEHSFGWLGWAGHV